MSSFNDTGDDVETSIDIPDEENSGFYICYCAWRCLRFLLIVLIIMSCAFVFGLIQVNPTISQSWSELWRSDKCLPSVIYAFSGIVWNFVWSACQVFQTSTETASNIEFWENIKRYQEHMGPIIG